MARFDKSIVDCCVVFLCCRSVVITYPASQSHRGKLPSATAAMKTRCSESIVTGSSKGSSDGAMWYAR